MQRLQMHHYSNSNQKFSLNDENIVDITVNWIDSNQSLTECDHIICLTFVQNG